MKTQSEINELKQIPIEYILSNREIYPTSKSGEWLMYCSPLREDHTASFGVNLKTNTFHDLGSGERGDVIQVVMKLDKISFGDACKVLEGFASRREIDFEDKTIFSSTCNTSESTLVNYQITAVKDLQHPALIRYVESRKITHQTAFSYLKEIHYKNAKGKFFGVGYKNDSEGYVLRSEGMKKPINLGKSGIKTFAVNSIRSVSIFEGMFDFLSAIEHFKSRPRCTAIILNSVTNLSKAMPLLKIAETIYSYLDNDNAGQKATQKMRDGGLNVLDQSHVYSAHNFKDFNDFLVNKPP